MFKLTCGANIYLKKTEKVVGRNGAVFPGWCLVCIQQYYTILLMSVCRTVANVSYMEQNYFLK